MKKLSLLALLAFTACKKQDTTPKGISTSSTEKKSLTSPFTLPPPVKPKQVEETLQLDLSKLTELKPQSSSGEKVPAADVEGIDAVKGWAWGRLAEAEQSFQKTGRGRMPSPAFWGDEIVYSIVVDRFNNGDTSNDRVNIEGQQANNEGKTDQGLADYRHGGDLQGIINRLDYLKELGITSLWITPLFTNSNGSYHGYCTSNFTQIDPGFGSNELFRDLVSKAHDRGIRVVLDIVVNHMCDDKTTYDNVKTPFDPGYYNMCLDDMDSRDWTSNNFVRGQRDLLFSQGFFGPFRSKYFFSRCGNRQGDFKASGAAAMFGDFSPMMFDFDTNNVDFQEIFTNIHKWWIAYADIDGFRVDAAKHVTADFLARLSTESRAYADRLGKNNFTLVGEVAAAPFEEALRVGHMRSDVYNPGNSGKIPQTLRNALWALRGTYSQHGAWALPGLNAIYDFTHSGSMAELWRRDKSPLGFKQYFYGGADTDHSQIGEGYGEINANGDTRQNWTVLEIHDWPRFATWKAPVSRMIGAMGHLMTTRGTPVVYYGYEQGLNADCHEDKIGVASGDARNEVLGICHNSTVENHPRYRQDMFMSGKWRLGSQIPAVNSLAGIGWKARDNDYQNWWDDPYLRTDHDLFKAVRRFAALRKSCSALRYGEMYFRAAHDNTSAGGLLAFSRVISQDKIEMLVVLNNSDSWQPVHALFIDSTINQQNGRVWKNLLNGFEQAWVGDLDGGKALYFADDFKFAPNSMAVFVDAANMSEYKDYLGEHLCLK